MANQCQTSSLPFTNYYAYKMNEEGIMKYFFILGAAWAGLSVVAGAFGAHALKSKLTPELLTIFETAARYQMYHAFALFLVAFLLRQNQSILFQIIAWLFCLGIFLSGYFRFVDAVNTR